MKNKDIRIEEVADINSDYPYLEVFFKSDTSPFLEIGISDDKQLFYKLYPSSIEILINEDDWKYIYSTGKCFLQEALKNEEDFLDFMDCQ